MLRGPMVYLLAWDRVDTQVGGVYDFATPFARVRSFVAAGSPLSQRPPRAVGGTNCICGFVLGEPVLIRISP